MAYREVSLTGWMDQGLKYFAEQAGIPLADYSSAVGGEGIAVGLEGIADVFTKAWLNRVIQGGAGALALSYAIWGERVPSRLRKELLALGMHEGLRVVNNPLTLQEDAESLRLFVEAIMRGDWNAALAQVLRTPGELGFRPAPAGGSPPQQPAGTQQPGGPQIVWG